MEERYLRQLQFSPIGPAGQEALSLARVAIVGQGALGCADAAYLARAGVGYLRLLDTDRVEWSNLQRQILYTEEDVGESKVLCAARHLKSVNSTIELDPREERLTRENAWELLEGVDLVLDAADNLAARLAVNEFCCLEEVPWIYGGVAGARGMTMNFLPGGPCLGCLLGGSWEEPPTTAAEEGIVGTLPPLMAAIQCGEALKLLTGTGRVRRSLLCFDVWSGEWEELALKRDSSCPFCRR